MHHTTHLDSRISELIGPVSSLQSDWRSRGSTPRVFLGDGQPLQRRPKVRRRPLSSNSAPYPPSCRLFTRPTEPSQVPQSSTARPPTARGRRPTSPHLASESPATHVPLPTFVGVLHESLAHSPYKRLKSNRGLRASRSRRCPIMAPATMAGPTKGKEGCLGTVGEA